MKDESLLEEIGGSLLEEKGGSLLEETGDNLLEETGDNLLEETGDNLLEEKNNPAESENTTRQKQLIEQLQKELEAAQKQREEMERRTQELEAERKKAAEAPTTNTQATQPTSAPQQKTGFFSRLFGGMFSSSSTPKAPAKTAEDYMRDAETAEANDDFESYMDNLKAAAKKGSAKACLYLGQQYFKGDNIVQDYKEGLKWFEKGAKRNDETCAITVGWCYAQGKGVECDLDAAIKYFEKSAKKGMGNVSAVYGIGYCYFWKLDNEYGITPTAESLECYDTAERWLQKAANKGNAGAQFLLGQLYLQFGHIHVRVIDYDDIHAKAYKWFRMAADQGHQTAKKQLFKFRGYWPGKEYKSYG